MSTLFMVAELLQPEVAVIRDIPMQNFRWIQMDKRCGTINKNVIAFTGRPSCSLKVKSLVRCTVSKVQEISEIRN